MTQLRKLAEAILDIHNFLSKNKFLVKFKLFYPNVDIYKSSYLYLGQKNCLGGLTLRKIIKIVLFLFLILSFPMMGLAAEEIEYEVKVKEFVNNQTQEFTIHELIQNDELKKALSTHLNKGIHEQITWKELKQSIQSNDGVFGNNERITIEKDSELNDFKIFQGIEVTELPKIILYTDKVFFEDTPHLTKIDLEFKNKKQPTTVDFSPLKHLTKINLKGDTITGFDVNNHDQITHLGLETYGIKNFNPMEFKNLQSINLKSMIFETIDLYNQPTLESFYANNIKARSIIIKDVDRFLISDSEAKELIVSNANNQEMWLHDNDIKDITFKNFENLENIYIQNNEKSKLEEITFKNVPKLRNIDIRNTSLTDISFVDTPNVQDILIINSKLQEIDLSTLPNLRSLDITNGEIKNIDLSQAPQLKGLGLTNNQIEEIDVLSLKNLESLYVNGNKLTSINIKGLDKLKRINLSNNQLTDIDLSDQTQLKNLYLNKNNLTSLKPFEHLLESKEFKFFEINSNKINLLSWENKPIHEQFKEKIIGEQDGYGPDYKYFDQRVEQVETGKPAEEIVHTFLIDEQTKGKRKQIPGTDSYITFPSNLREGSKMKVKKVSTEKANKLLSTKDEIKVAGDIFEFNFNNDYIQDEPFILSLAYDAANYNLEEWEIGIYYFNEETEEWEFVGGEVDATNSIVTVQVNHFSTYGVLATPKDDPLHTVDKETNENKDTNETQQEGKRLPDTSTPYYNFIVLGLALLLIGGIFLYKMKRKHVN